MSHRGGHGGWHRRCNLTPTDVRIVEDEDQFNDNERAHTWEETGLVAFAQPFDVDLGFLAWYEMEEMVWNTGAAGQVVNSAGTSLDGTPADSAQTSQATPAFTSGIDSTCRYGTFDGATDGATDGVADGVEIGNDDLGLVDQVSVSAWVRWAIDPATGNPSAVIAQNSSSASFDDFQFGLRGSASNAEFEFRVETTAGLQFASTSGNLAAADTWFYVTGVYDDVLAGTAAHSGDLVAYDPARELMIGKAAADALNNFGAFTGLIDELRLYRRALSLDEIKLLRQFTGPCPVLLDHYAVSHVGAGGGFGITCAAEAVLITGHDAANGPIAPPTGTIMTVTAAPVDPAATWILGGIGTGIFADLGGGVATYEFDGVETQVELLLAQPTLATVSFTISDGGGRAIGAGEGPALEFSDLGLRFDPLAAEIAGKPTTITVQVTETNTLTGACQASVPPPATLDFAFECANPTTGCTGVTSGVVEDTTLAVPTTVDAFDLGAATPANNVTLSFDPVTSTATINVQYDDAGTVSLVAAGDAGTPARGVSGRQRPVRRAPVRTARRHHRHRRYDARGRRLHGDADPGDVGPCRRRRRRRHRRWPRDGRSGPQRQCRSERG